MKKTRDLKKIDARYAPVVEVITTAEGKAYWRILAPNGRQTYTSDLYSNKQSAENNLKSVIKALSNRRLKVVPVCKKTQ